MFVFRREGIHWRSIGFLKARKRAQIMVQRTQPRSTVSVSISFFTRQHSRNYFLSSKLALSPAAACFSRLAHMRFYDASPSSPSTASFLLSLLPSPLGKRECKGRTHELLAKVIWSYGGCASRKNFRMQLPRMRASSISANLICFSALTSLADEVQWYEWRGNALKAEETFINFGELTANAGENSKVDFPHFRWHFW